MSFSLWRQDDNGNQFLVGVYADRAAAEARLAELTRVLHKQTYWISTSGAHPDPNPKPSANMPTLKKEQI